MSLNDTYVYIGFTGFVVSFTHWNFTLRKRIGKNLDIVFNRTWMIKCKFVPMFASQFQVRVWVFLTSCTRCVLYWDTWVIYMVLMPVIVVLIATIHKISFLSTLLYMWVMNFTIWSILSLGKAALNQLCRKVVGAPNSF